jgi:hypothetical protein
MPVRIAEVALAEPAITPFAKPGGDNRRAVTLYISSWIKANEHDEWLSLLAAATAS